MLLSNENDKTTEIASSSLLPLNFHEKLISVNNLYNFFS